jgi:hypothetical protein
MHFRSARVDRRRVLGGLALAPAAIAANTAAAQEPWPSRTISMIVP